MFLDRHGAEVLCGPVDVPDCVDMSGLGGVITLTGPELLKIKSRSFLLHIKAMINPGQGQDRAAKKPNPPKSKQEVGIVCVCVCVWPNLDDVLVSVILQNDSFLL